MWIASRLSRFGTGSGKARTGRVEKMQVVFVTSSASDVGILDFVARENGGVRR